MDFVHTRIDNLHLKIDRLGIFYLELVQCYHLRYNLPFLEHVYDVVLRSPELLLERFSQIDRVANPLAAEIMARCLIKTDQASLAINLLTKTAEAQKSETLKAVPLQRNRRHLFQPFVHVFERTPFL